MPTIKFISNRPWLSTESKSLPTPILKTLPEWYKNADRFARKPDGEHWSGPDGGKIPTWKACPAIYDIMGSGYVYKTPCDIEFYINDTGVLSARIEDPMYQDFVSQRFPMPQFTHPHGYEQVHFAWWADWAVSLPEGYSALYSQPFNRYELPFITTNGIIDNDKVNLPGTMPFFVQKGWTGVLPAGTPYAQILPFKREDWDSEVVLVEPQQMYSDNMENSAKYRLPDGGIYQREVWERRKYE